MREYLDFRIEMSGLHERRFVVNAACSVGETRGSTEVSYDADMVDRLLRILRGGIVSPQEFLGLAAALGNMLLPGEVGDLFLAAFPTTDNEGIRLRLVIRDPQLSALPWEYAYFPLGDREGMLSPYLALHPAVSVIRHEARPVPQASMLASAEDACRVLAVSARRLPGLPELSGSEAEVIGRALRESQGDDRSGLRFELVLIDDPVTEPALQAGLSEPYDLFQFSGHSARRRRLDGSWSQGLAISDGRGARQLLTPDRLAVLLLDASVKVALINACSPPEAVGADRLALGAQLVDAGVPAAITMQFEVEDSHAIAFSKGFYSALAAGLSLDESVSLGRRRMHELGIMASWGAPVTFSRSPDGRLFAVREFSGARAADQPEVARTALSVAYQAGRIAPPAGPIEPRLSATILGFCARWHPPETRDERAEINALSAAGHADSGVRDLLRILGSAYPDAIGEAELGRMLQVTDRRQIVLLRRRANLFLKAQEAGQLSQFSIELAESAGLRSGQGKEYRLQRLPVAELLDHSADAHIGLDFNLRHAISLYDVGRYGESLTLMTGMLDVLANRPGTLTVPEHAIFFYTFSKALLKLNWYDELQAVLEGPYLRLSRSVLKDLEVERLQVAGIRFRQLGEPVAAQACFDAAVNTLIEMGGNGIPVVMRGLGDNHVLRALCRLDLVVSERQPTVARLASLRIAAEALGQARSYFERLREISGSGTHYEGRLNGTSAFLGVARSLVDAESINLDYWAQIEALARGGFEPERDRKPFGVVAGKFAMSITLLAKARWHSTHPHGHGEAAAWDVLDQAAALLRSLFTDYLEPGRIQLGATFEMPKLQLALSSVEELRNAARLDAQAWDAVSAREAIWSPLV